MFADVFLRMIILSDDSNIWSVLALSSADCHLSFDVIQVVIFLVTTGSSWYNERFLAREVGKESQNWYYGETTSSWPRTSVGLLIDS